MDAWFKDSPKINMSAAFLALNPIKVRRESDDWFHTLLFLWLSKMLSFSVRMILTLPTAM